MLSISRARSGSTEGCCASEVTAVASASSSRSWRKLMRNSVRDMALIDAADEALEVAGFRQSEDLGVVGRSGAGVEELHAAACVGCCCGHDFREVGERDVVRAGAGDECSTGG